MEPLCIVGGNVKWFSCCGKWYGDSSNNETGFPYDPAISLLDVYPKEVKAGTQRDICTTTFTAALFTVGRKWKQPKCPWMDEWINKM